MLACEVCALDPSFSFATNHRKPSVASFPGFEYKGQRCYTACFTHRNIMDMPPPDAWKPRRNASGPRDSFLTDFENDVLRDFATPPTGPRRHLDPHWAALVRRSVDPYHTDVTWCEYVEWVQGGGGDEWFQPQEPQ
jgi:hypothetical protein